jgi:hypothetical protein
MPFMEGLPATPRAIQERAEGLQKRTSVSPVRAEIDADELLDPADTLDPEAKRLLEEAQQIADEYERQ